ncbi:MAG: hypothetical protein AAF630_04025 [Cyanobacteria bacterium P01_C01_bin.38]
MVKNTFLIGAVESPARGTSSRHYFRPRLSDITLRQHVKEQQVSALLDMI